MLSRLRDSDVPEGFQIGGPRLTVVVGSLSGVHSDVAYNAKCDDHEDQCAK